ncbi:MAG: flagellar hook-length control protein FliK, partial [Lachnospiraceae bacterium]|nr:flagellar hook-length control protein FliK [Lachnospiraceae bacterium]
DILEDLGLEATEANERAVRILGYNSLEITTENISVMKYADETVQSAFKALTPKTVTSMIKSGYNPLDMKLTDLIEKAKEVSASGGDSSSDTKDQSSSDDAKGYAEFLWKLERQNGITEEQRQSFIGVYRLIHQVEKTDGAVIGQLLNQGADLTLRNMMGAVRTKKKGNMDYTVDDDFAGVNSTTSSLSITQQIEASFMTMRTIDAGDVISPSKMMQFENEDSYMNMNPDQFASALENMDSDKAEEEAFVREEISRMQQAVASEEKVYQMLHQMDFPTTPAYLEAWSQYLNNRNQMYKNLANNLNSDREVFSEIGSDLDFENLDLELQTTMEDIIEAMGEASKTPEEMAEAQEKLAETAENVMRNMLVEKDATSIDVRGMQITVKQLQMLGQRARETEQFAIPIMVADEYGNMSLKIVRGKEEDKGQVDITFDMETTGAVSASFKYENDVLDGSITTSEPATRELLSSRMSEIASAMQKAAEMPVSLSFGWDEGTDANSIYDEKEYDFETTTEQRSIQTTKLYGIAKAFITSLGEIAS